MCGQQRATPTVTSTVDAGSRLPNSRYTRCLNDAPYRVVSPRDTDEPDPDPRGPWVLQTWVSRRDCPDCGIPLFAARQEGFRIDACGTCGGAWLDHHVARRAVEERSLVPARLSREAARHSRASPRAQHRKCPVCASELVATHVADAYVVIDVCMAHGTWFDPDEIRLVVEAMVRRTPPQVDPSVDREIERAESWASLRPPANYQPSPGNWDLVGALIRLATRK